MAKGLSISVHVDGFEPSLRVDFTWYEDEHDIVIEEVRCPDNGPNILDIIAGDILAQLEKACAESLH